MGANKVQRTMDINRLKQEEILGDGMLVEMNKRFGGFKVFVLVPPHAGVSPAMVQQKYDEQMNMLLERASQPTLRELINEDAVIVDAYSRDESENKTKEN